MNSLCTHCDVRLTSRETLDDHRESSSCTKKYIGRCTKCGIGVENIASDFAKSWSLHNDSEQCKKKCLISEILRKSSLDKIVNKDAVAINNKRSQPRVDHYAYELGLAIGIDLGTTSG